MMLAPSLKKPPFTKGDLSSERLTKTPPFSKSGLSLLTLPFISTGKVKVVVFVSSLEEVSFYSHKVVVWLSTVPVSLGKVEASFRDTMP